MTANTAQSLKDSIIYLPCKNKYMKIIFRAFLLAVRRSRRATGYAIASVRCTMLAHALRMPNACA